MSAPMCPRCKGAGVVDTSPPGVDAAPWLQTDTDCPDCNGTGLQLKCGEEFARHPTLPHLVAICTRPTGHAGAHNNVLPKGGQLTDPGPSDARPPLRVVEP